MFCNQCGTQNQDGVRFCVNCGADLAASQQPQTTPNQQPQGNPYQNNPYQQPVYQAPKQPGHGFAVASLVLGIVSFFISAIIAGSLAIVFGSVAKSKGNTGKLATAGIICGIVGIALWAFFLILGASFLGALSL